MLRKLLSRLSFMGKLEPPEQVTTTKFRIYANLKGDQFLDASVPKEVVYVYLLNFFHKTIATKSHSINDVDRDSARKAELSIGVTDFYQALEEVGEDLNRLLRDGFEGLGAPPFAWLRGLHVEDVHSRMQAIQSEKNKYDQPKLLMDTAAAAYSSGARQMQKSSDAFTSKLAEIEEERTQLMEYKEKARLKVMAGLAAFYKRVDAVVRQSVTHHKGWHVGQHRDIFRGIETTGMSLYDPYQPPAVTLPCHNEIEVQDMELVQGQLQETYMRGLATVLTDHARGFPLDEKDEKDKKERADLISKPISSLTFADLPDRAGIMSVTSVGPEHYCYVIWGKADEGSGAALLNTGENDLLKEWGLEEDEEAETETEAQEETEAQAQAGAQAEAQAQAQAEAVTEAETVEPMPHHIPKHLVCAQDLDGLTPNEGENTARAAAEIPHESMSSMSQGTNSPSGDDGEDFATPASVDGHSALPSCPGDAGPPQTFEPRLFGPAYEMQRGRMSCGTIRHGGVGGMSGSLTAGSLKSVLTIVRNSVMSDYEMVDIGAGCGVVLLCSFAYGATLATGIEVKDDGLQHVLQACKPVLEAFSVPSCNICVHFGTDVSQCESLPTLQQGQSYQGPALPKVVFSFCDGFNVVDRQHCFRLVGLDANVKMFVCSPGKGSGAREEDVPVIKYVVHGGSASGTLDLTSSPACFPRSNIDSEYDNLESVLHELQITHGLQRPINFPFTAGDCFFDALSVVMNDGTSAQQLRDATVRTIVNALKNADENAWRQYGYDICNNGGPGYVLFGGHYVLAMGNPGEIWASSFMVDSCASGLGLRLRIFTAVDTASGVYRISSRYSGAIAGEVLNLLYTGDEKGHFEPLIPKDKSYVSSRGSSMLGLSLPHVQYGLPYSPPSRNAIKEALVQFGCLGLYRKLQIRGHNEMSKAILSHALWHFEVDALRNGIQLAEIVEEVAKQFVISQRN
ncbi:hypothetical protein CEUSTIGMA_g13599.t1 [Chlamydomonas eustigma]|uniref:OTU domain-containing protein n=1 Tax=Chlamydomonas eustigma TaxID=1157962 RepID=A0A250XT23_9CHLO|nr:hypothetical protein CEUSTIGMA_g13599.t1 [Chlamydomonas eustigma]|eukprot:GAX86186.1 hypothetical protein CEUSTIGMA_g13599.t1 [Chlamydomonas eustigma]